jgi:isoamylase
MLMRNPQPELKFKHRVPYGAIPLRGGVQFIVISRGATAMRLLIYKQVKDREPYAIYDFDQAADRWGDAWSIFVPGLKPGALYHYQADGPCDPEQGQRFDGKARLIDPYAKALAGDFLPATDGIVRPPKSVVVDDNHFNWEGDRQLRRPDSESIIYEMHVRGFTKHRSSKVKHPGTYLGVIEKIPYLQSLGVTAVELLPVHEFPILNPQGEKYARSNYWGYDTMNFFSPHRGYAHSKRPGAQVKEFKEMVKALHAAGIEVILDVVYNHTCEGNENGPTISFKGLENQMYYMLAGKGEHYMNFSGCGNSVNCNHPVVRELIINSLRHWVHNYHVDGFRFDLASILNRDRHGNLHGMSPLVEAIAEDPLLADTKLIAEAWDAAGAYQVGSFGNIRWAEWNGRYRDDIRRFWRGDYGMLGGLATRLAGSSDLYGNRRPSTSVNFITSHDGFPMNDLVCYNDKHNEENGEDNRDGDNNNHSYNYGVEGPTRRKDITAIRERQIRNMMATLLLSQGVPMITMGDEIRRTQRGNNNAYCQDNKISWFDWTLVEKNADMLRFVQCLNEFRANQATVRRKKFLTGRPAEEGELPDVSWFNALGESVDWNNGDPTMICLLKSPTTEQVETSRDVLLLINGATTHREFVLPTVALGEPWQLFFDTAAEAPADIYDDWDGPAPPASGRLPLAKRSLRCYVSPERQYMPPEVPSASEEK